ncbi:MAG TPA: CYTH and CHAD domain-containing protein, partial [Casimicrobiaceae bacterium]|nr:CYTH and CHAD domain-containing protein [Casimicrobiaceae bacterium]
MAAKLEQELRLRVAPREAQSLLDQPVLGAYAAGAPQQQRLVTTYYDTASDSLARAGIALRVRVDGTQRVQTIKGPPHARSGASLAARAEYEWPLRTADPDLQLAAETPWRARIATAQSKGLLQRFATRITRTTLPLRWPDGTQATLCIDRGVIDTAMLQEPVCEIEIELDHGDIRPLFDLALALASTAPMAIEPRTKAARAFALLHREPSEPVRATPIPLARAVNAGHALATILRNCVQQLEGNADGLRGHDDPEWVHQMRVATRRLRACLALMRRAARSPTWDTVSDDARWLARMLGNARDCDVVATQTLPRAAQAIGNGANAPLQRLREATEAHRVQAREAARNAVASGRFTHLVLNAGALAAALDAIDDPAHPLGQDATAWARVVLDRRHRKLMRRGAHLRKASVERRHAVRLAAKRTRYAVEFVTALFPERKDDARQYRRALSRLQDILGTMNDAHVALRLAEEMNNANDLPITA